MNKLFDPARAGRGTLLALALAAGSAPALADSRITLIEMGDLHGTLVPHAAVLKNPDGSERMVASSGGLARLKTLVDDIRADNPEAVLLSCGDLTHGSAEAMFTVGDAMMNAINAFDIDVFTPGNWDFGYGAAVFRNRFASRPPFPPLPANIQVMASADGVPGVTRAAFPVVAANLYNDPALPLPPQLDGKRILDPYRILERDGVKIAVIGLTAAIVPQQADTFNIGLRFTQGVEELPGLLEEVKAAGADIIVVQSELGMSQNLKLAESFPDIDVMYSAHTHEVTLGALLAGNGKSVRTTPGERLSHRERRMLRRGAAIVVETNRDMYVGRLDLTVDDGRIVDFTWEAIPVDESVAEDPDMAALVASIEEDFVAGEDGIVKRHSFLPGGFGGDPSLRGLQLVDDLDTVVGYTDTLLLRHHVLEDTLNNFLADAIRAVTSPVVAASGMPGWENGVDISMANGFRFGNAVLPGSAITLRDLYTWFPIAPAVNVADFSGQSIQNSLETILGAVFNRNPFLQRGGWYLGLSNMTQKIDLDNRPFSSSSGRIVETTVGGQRLDPGRRYVFASCYGHGNPLDEVCRTGGGANFRFFELADPDDYNSALSLVMPVNETGIIRGPVVKQVAPDNFLHPVHALRRYLDSLPDRTVHEADFGVGRVQTVDSTREGNPPVPPPVPEPDPTFVQPPQGAGPVFLSGVLGGREGQRRHHHD
ncbi:5'-nucleotidase C-terminal domain-containing protein [Thiohalobacter sp. IOR34]|uniref:bifunctional metallophosphatase/5'-nucleotidase n=1 Tax=Thiohalobacter sp. IOR34 TaxID=3057176 RepID=UPI0025B03DEC|nr:5'-nucleotidase C-terminal domain-containing protein [Thiohalobacter sp. IOR34]WJW75740.1 5'-nucleotidase C-terminal domain-containing protein [Thiohalobacter sp. IOR34]